MVDKENKLTTDLIKRLYSILHQTNLDRDELSALAQQDREKLASFLEPAFPWSFWYEIPYTHVLVLLLEATGLLEKFYELRQKDNFWELFLDHFDSDLDVLDEAQLSDEENAIIASLFLALIHHLSALSIFNQTLDTFVQRVKDGDDKALFDAVLVDRTFATTPSIAKRIQIAQLQEDESFFAELSKAITRTRPRRPAQEYDDFRFMVSALDDCKAFSAKTTEEFYELLVGELELYQTNGKDSFKGFEKMIERIRKTVNDT